MRFSKNSVGNICGRLDSKAKSRFKYPEENRRCKKLGEVAVAWVWTVALRGDAEGPREDDLSVVALIKY